MENKTWLLILFLPVISLCGSGCVSSGIAQGIPWNAESPSLILRSRVIFSFLIESIDPMFPVDDMPYGYNTWRLTGHTLEIYKGSPGQKEGTVFEAMPSIYIGPVHGRPIGIWFGLDYADTPQAGESWVIFCNPEGEAAKPGDLLSGKGEGCTAYSLKDARVDLELAGKISAGHLAFDSAIQLARESIKDIGPLFCSFLWESFKEAAIDNPLSFDKICGLLENPALGRTSRYTLVDDLETFFSMHDGDPNLRKMENRFIVSMFMLLKQKEIENSNDNFNLMGTYIPNLLGIDSGLEKRTADEVFSGFLREREQTLILLESSPHKKEAAVLLDWIAH